MKPPFSMILFTVLAGTAQGLVLALCALEWLAQALGAPPDARLFVAGAVVALGLSGVGLVCASFHLGHPSRAWRAAAMWRTSWLSREVIVLPLFMLAVTVWGGLHLAQALAPALAGAVGSIGPASGLRALTALAGSAAAVLALLLYVCTGMIYAAVRVIREWATPLTPLSFLLLGLACGALLAGVLAAAWAPGWTSALLRLALAATLLGALARGWQLWRNHAQAGATTIQTAIGVRHPRIVQTSQGTMAGSFGTREFFHGRTDGRVRLVRALAVGLGFVLPAALLAGGLAGAGALALAVLSLLQNLGILAERWVFFADARHPQNLYQQALRTAGR